MCERSRFGPPNTQDSFHTCRVIQTWSGFPVFVNKVYLVCFGSFPPRAGRHSGIRQSLQRHLCVVGRRLPAGPHLPDTSLLLGRHQSQLPREQLRLEQHGWANHRRRCGFFFFVCLFFFAGFSIIFRSVRRRTPPRCTKRMLLLHKDSDPTLIWNTRMSKETERPFECQT